MDLGPPERTKYQAPRTQDWDGRDSDQQRPSPEVDALLLVFRNFRPRMDRIPRVTDGDLASLAMPVHVVVGSDDPLLNSRETRVRVERFVRNASVTWIDGSGHILPSQASTVADFLKGARTQSTPAIRSRIAASDACSGILTSS